MGRTKLTDDQVASRALSSLARRARVDSGDAMAVGRRREADAYADAASLLEFAARAVLAGSPIVVPEKLPGF